MNATRAQSAVSAVRPMLSSVSIWLIWRANSRRCFPDPAYSKDNIHLRGSHDGVVLGYLLQTRDDLFSYRLHIIQLQHDGPLETISGLMYSRL